MYLLVGYGLVRLNPHSLAWAMFFTWVGLICLPTAAAFSLFVSSHFQVFGLNVGQAPRALCFSLCTAAMGLCCWQYRVLKDRQVRQLFVS